MTVVPAAFTPHSQKAADKAAPGAVPRPAPGAVPRITMLHRIAAVVRANGAPMTAHEIARKMRREGNRNFLCQIGRAAAYGFLAQSNPDAAPSSRWGRQPVKRYVAKERDDDAAHI